MYWVVVCYKVLSVDDSSPFAGSEVYVVGVIVAGGIVA